MTGPGLLTWFQSPYFDTPVRCPYYVFASESISVLVSGFAVTYLDISFFGIFVWYSSILLFFVLVRFVLPV